MKAKVYLNELARLDKSIDYKQLELESLEALVTNVNSKLKQINVQESERGDKLGDTAVKIIQLQNEINADVDEFVKRKLEAMQLMAMMKDKEFANILIRRYINYESWETIAEKLHYSRQSIFKKHGQALIEFQKVLDGKIES